MHGEAYFVAMALPLSDPAELTDALPARTGRAIAIVGLALAAVVFMAALALWFHYGTTVFFETIAAGIAGCF
ncbi:MAG: hypothetical protein ACM3OF_03955 [Gemmatimonas sp.]